MSEIKEAVQHLEAKITEFKSSSAEEVKKTVEEVKSLVKKQEDSFAETVKQINEDGKKSGESLAEIKSKVDAFAAKLGRMGDMTVKPEIKSMAQLIGLIIQEKYEEIKSFAPGQQFMYRFEDTKIAEEFKSAQTMTTSTNNTGNLVISHIDRVPDRGIYPFHLRQILSIFPTATGAVNYSREVVPVGEGSFAKNTEGSPKALLDYDFQTISLSLKFIAGRAKISREMLQDLPFIQAYLSKSLTEDFLRQEDTYYLNDIASLATAGSTSASVTIEKILDYMDQVENAGYLANAVITTPAVRTAIQKTKPADYSLPVGISWVDGRSVFTIRNAEMYVSPLVTASKVYVLDTGKLGIAQASGFNIRSTEFNNDDFDKNLVSFRAEARCDLMQFAPSASVYGAS